MADLAESIKKGNVLYQKLMVQNAERFHTIRTGSKEEIKMMFLSQREKSLRNEAGYAIALQKMQLVSTRFYVQGIDITLAMREKIYKDKYHLNSDGGKFLVKSLELAEKDLLKEYLCCRIGMPTENDIMGYEHYLECARKVNEYLGEPCPQEAYIENVQAFRKLVKELVNARKKCGLCASFTSTYVSDINKPWLNQEVLTYEKALEIAEDIIDNYAQLRYGKAGVKIEDCVDEESLVDELCLEETPLHEEIQEKFITKFIEQCGLNREMYKTYMSGSVYVPNKKFLIALGLFCEPWCDMESKDCEELAMIGNLEQFLNQNSFSIMSLFGTVSDYDNMLDEQLRYLIEDGLSLDMLAYMLKHFAKTGKDIKKLANE